MSKPALSTCTVCVPRFDCDSLIITCPVSVTDATVQILFVQLEVGILIGDPDGVSTSKISPFASLPVCDSPTIDTAVPFTVAETGTVEMRCPGIGLVVGLPQPPNGPVQGFAGQPPVPSPEGPVASPNCTAPAELPGERDTVALEQVCPSAV